MCFSPRCKGKVFLSKCNSVSGPTELFNPLTRGDYWKAAHFLDIFWSVMSQNYSKWNMRARGVSLHQHPVLWLFIHRHTEKLNPTSLDFSHFIFFAVLVFSFWALFQFKNFWESIIQMGNSYQGIREHVDTWFKCEKFAVIVHALEKKKKKMHYFMALSCNWM